MDVSTLHIFLFTSKNLNIYRLNTPEKAFEQYGNRSIETKEEIWNRFETFKCGDCSPKMVETHPEKKEAQVNHITYYLKNAFDRQDPKMVEKRADKDGGS